MFFFVVVDKISFPEENLMNFQQQKKWMAMNYKDDGVRESVCGAFRQLFREDKKGQISLDAVRQVKKNTLKSNPKTR